MKKRSEIAMGYPERPALRPSKGPRVCGGSNLLLLFAILSFLFLPELADAQCSMCRASTASNQLSDDAFTIGNGLNNAIVYLMFMPYIMAGIFIYAFFRKQITALFKKKFA